MSRRFISNLLICFVIILTGYIVYATEDEGNSKKYELPDLVPLPKLEKQYATCDICAFCISANHKELIKNGIPSKEVFANLTPPVEPPKDWSKCANCYYPSLNIKSNDDAYTGKTLEIDANGIPVVMPKKGAYYTILGCVNTDLKNFQEKGAGWQVVGFILNALLIPLGSLLSFFYILYGAFLLATARGQPQKLNTGKSILIGAVVGLILLLSTMFIINIIMKQILNIPGF